MFGQKMSEMNLQHNLEVEHFWNFDIVLNE